MQRLIILFVVGWTALAMLVWHDTAQALHFGDGRLSPDTMIGRDFVNLWTAGRAVIDGQTDVLYSVANYQEYQRAIVHPAIDHHNYSYPPVTLLYAPLFGALPYGVALVLFLALSLAAFLIAARPWMARAGLPLAAAMVPAAGLCLWAGHYGLILGALWLAAWHWVDDRPRLAGVAAGLMIIKPHLAILIPLLFLRRRAWTAIASAAATVGLLVGVSVVVFGTEPWQQWVGGTVGLQLDLVHDSKSLFALMMPTIPTTLIFWGLTPHAAAVVHAVLALAVVALLAWRAPDDRYRCGALGAVATFLVLPYGFNYDMVAASIGALLFAIDAIRREQSMEALVAGLFLAVPPAMIWTGLADIRFAPLVVLAAFAAMWWRWALRPGRGGEPVALGA